MTYLENVMSDYDLEYRRLSDGLETTRIPSLRSRLNSQLRTNYKTRFLNGTYTTVQYLNFVSLTIEAENISVSLISTENELQSVTEETHSSDDGESVDARCFICLQERTENFAFLHYNFAHAGFCEQCANELHQANRECPICRGKIDGIMKIFQ